MQMITGEVARRFNCSAENVRRWERQGKLKAEKTATGQRIFNSEEVERFAKEREARRQERTA